MSRVFLLLNDPLVAARLRATLDAAGGLEVVGTAHTLAQALVQLGPAQAELVLADLQFSDGGLAGALPALVGDAHRERPRVLAAALSLGDAQLLEALSRGADGYVVQGLAATALVQAVRQALAGEATMAPQIAREVQARFDALDPQQPDAPERVLLQWVASGYLPEEIAVRMKISPREVGRRIGTIYRRLRDALRARSASLAT